MHPLEKLSLVLVLQLSHCQKMLFGGIQLVWFFFISRWIQGRNLQVGGVESGLSFHLFSLYPLFFHWQKIFACCYVKTYSTEIWAVSYLSWKADALQIHPQEAKCATEELNPCFVCFSWNKKKKKDWVPFIIKVDLVMHLRVGKNVLKENFG